LLIQIELLETLKCGKLLLKMVHFGRCCIIARHEYLCIRETLSNGSICGILKQLSLHLFNTLKILIYDTSLVFALLPINLNFKLVQRRLLLYVRIPLLSQVNNLSMIFLCGIYQRIITLIDHTAFMFDFLDGTTLLIYYKGRRIIIFFKG